MITKKIQAAGGKVDYVEAINADTLEPVEGISGKIMIAVAAYFGATRLIDNIITGNN